MNNPLNNTQLEILRDILNLSLEDKVIAKEYRRKNATNIPVINDLAQNQLLRHNQEDDTYTLSLVALYLTDNDISASIYENADKVCEFLRAQFAEAIEEHSYQALESGTDIDRANLTASITFLCDASQLACNFSKDTNDYIIYTNESLFSFDSLKEYTERFLPSWFPDHFKKDQNKKPHGNTEVNASKREAILRAAVAALAHFPDQCKTKSGTIQGKKVADILEQKSLIFFPQYDGEPPASTDTITRTINECLKLIK